MAYISTHLDYRWVSKVASFLRIGPPGSPRVAVTGTICFDTDFPWLTRGLSAAGLLLESSQTWGYIGELWGGSFRSCQWHRMSHLRGRQHLRGHQLLA